MAHTHSPILSVLCYVARSKVVSREPSADKISIQNLTPQHEELPIVEADIAFQEVEIAVNQLKDGRLPGLDNIPGKELKNGGL